MQPYTTFATKKRLFEPSNSGLSQYVAKDDSKQRKITEAYNIISVHISVHISNSLRKAALLAPHLRLELGNRKLNIATQLLFLHRRKCYFQLMQ